MWIPFFFRNKTTILMKKIIKKDFFISLLNSDKRGG